jgi:hypothetical protein
MTRILRRIEVAVLASLLAMIAGCGGGGGGGTEPVPDTSANLSALVLDQVTLVPAFASNVSSYTGEVPNSVTSTRITPTAVDPDATIRVNDVVLASGTASDPIDLAEGENAITVVVTAENGTTTRTYTVTVTRRPPPSSNADLARLALTVAPLDQLFDPAVTAYTTAAGYFGTSTRVIAVPENDFATLELNGTPLASGVPSAPIPLAVGSNALEVVATAEDAVTSRSYGVDVTRGPLAAVGLEAYAKAFNTDAGDRFGTSLGLCGDVLAVGAPGEDSGATGIDGFEFDESQTDAGAVYLFDRQGGTWTPAAYVKASNTDAQDRFGSSLSLCGGLLLVGAPGEDSNARGVDGFQGDDTQSEAGAAYLLERSGGLWDHVAYLKASNTEALDRFGASTDLSGERLVIGAPGEDSAATDVGANEDDNSQSDSGAAYVFERSGGLWAQTAYVKATNTDALDEFGTAVALDGDTLLIGAPGEDSPAGNQADDSVSNAGAVYVYAADTDALWSWFTFLKASNPDAEDRFGSDVALDGDLLAVGAPGEDGAVGGIDGNQADDSAASAGAVYVFERASSGGWSQVAYVKASNPHAFDEFGASVELHGNLLVVGAPGQSSSWTGINGDELDESAPDAGAVYLFERDASGVWSQIAYVKASNTDAGDRFGSAVAFHGDTLSVGAPAEQSSAIGIDGNPFDDNAGDAGAVYVIR